MFRLNHEQLALKSYTAGVIRSAISKCLKSSTDQIIAQVEAQTGETICTADLCTYLGFEWSLSPIQLKRAATLEEQLCKRPFSSEVFQAYDEAISQEDGDGSSLVLVFNWPHVGRHMCFYQGAMPRAGSGRYWYRTSEENESVGLPFILTDLNSLLASSDGMRTL